MAERSNKSSGSKPRHIPQRTCIACRRTEAKRGLIRVVRDGEGRLVVDPSGRLNGRGAYLCHDPACWAMALKRHALERALRIASLHPDDRAMLVAYSQGLPPNDDADLSPQAPCA